MAYLGLGFTTSFDNVDAECARLQVSSTGIYSTNPKYKQPIVETIKREYDLASFDFATNTKCPHEGSRYAFFERVFSCTEFAAAIDPSLPFNTPASENFVKFQQHIDPEATITLLVFNARQ